MMTNCKFCGNQFEGNQANIKRGRSLYCSKSCAAKQRLPEIVRQRSLNVAKANYDLIKDKFKNEVAFISNTPSSMTDLIILNCHIHGNVETNLKALIKAKKACKHCSQGKQIIMNNNKQCTNCNEWKDISQYTIEKKKRYKAFCIECDRERKREGARHRWDKSKNYENQKRYRERHGIVTNYKTNITICKCEYCSKVWVNKGTTSKKFCSNQCGKQSRINKRAGATFTKSVKQYSCKSCNVLIMAKHPSYCVDCKQLNKKIARKKGKQARARSSVKIHNVTSRKVFERDKWRCQLCNIKVQKNDYLLDNAAEVDHIVPVSLGGVHSYSNVQTLCRKCNQTKSNKYHGQLVLAL
jgi:hypothetical protein